MLYFIKFNSTIANPKPLIHKSNTPDGIMVLLCCEKLDASLYLHRENLINVKTERNPRIFFNPEWRSILCVSHNTSANEIQPIARLKYEDSARQPESNNILQH